MRRVADAELPPYAGAPRPEGAVVPERERVLGAGRDRRARRHPCTCLPPAWPSPVAARASGAGRAPGERGGEPASPVAALRGALGPRLVDVTSHAGPLPHTKTRPADVRMIACASPHATETGASSPTLSSGSGTSVGPSIGKWLDVWPRLNLRSSWRGWPSATSAVPPLRSRRSSLKESRDDDTERAELLRGGGLRDRDGVTALSESARDGGFRGDRAVSSIEAAERLLLEGANPNSDAL